MSTARKPITGISGVARFGWSPEPPSIKDWKASVAPFAGAAIPDESEDRRPINPPVRDQGNIGSCTGFSSTYAVGYLLRTDKHSRHQTVYSPMFAYYNGRVADGEQWKTVDSGAYIRDVVDQLRKTGVCPESTWNYHDETRRFATTPSKTAYEAAKRWKLGATYRCETIEDIMRALSSGAAVVAGVILYDDMDNQGGGRIPMPNRNAQQLGGHAIYVDRYSQADRLFRFENSWSTKWGDGGYGYLPFDYLASRDLSDDIWALVSEAPETTPWKD